MQADLSSFTEAQIRLAFFLGILLIIAVWEVFWPRRKQLYPRAARWPSNIGIVVLNTLILRIMFPTAAVGVAEYASANQLGILNRFNFGFNLPWWDRLLGTYKAQPQAGHKNMTIGLVTFTGKKQITKLTAMLLIPFTREEHLYPLNRGSLQPGNRSAGNED